MIVVSISGAIAALGIVKYENFVCKAQETEAKGVLRNILDVETAIFAEDGTYAALPTCTFGYGFPCTSTTISLEFKGRPRFSYGITTNNVQPFPSTAFTATAIGTTGAVLGGVLTVNQDGLLDYGGSACKTGN